MEEQTYLIHVEGLVQGVGFRPLVYRLAREWELCGEVQNAGDGLRVFFTADAERAHRFYRSLLDKAPRLAHITSHRMEPIASRSFQDFRIIHSVSGPIRALLPSPDYALCSNCCREMLDPDDRRYGYAFITCTHCGPRLSILTGLPYDRPLTTMAPFPMCPPCLAEYNDPLNRRHFSQTNSCPDCGIQLQWRAAGEDARRGRGALDRAAELIRNGGILALRGIGGYLLLCDATRAAVVWALRRRKNRPHKPFAVLYPSLDLLAGDAGLPPAGRPLLEGPVAPILLCRLREDPASGLAVEAVAPGLEQIGVMLPYAPLLERVAQALPRLPLIATSGNRGGYPIAASPGEAEAQLEGIADGFLHHNRDISVPQDDSVVRISNRHGRRIWLRRSRGLAPNVPWPRAFAERKSALALGADLKSAFALYDGQQAFLSPYLGELSDYDTELRFEQQLHNFLEILQVRPGQLLADLHPDYASTRLGRRLAGALGLPLAAVQHHVAHACAALGAEGWTDAGRRALCLAWDGTGLGADGHIWGSEALLWEEGRFHRHAHLPYVPQLAGDQMARQPRLSALAFFPGAGLEDKFSEGEWELYQRLRRPGGGAATSSMGRLFDAVSSLLGLADRITYEGQAAMALEQLARQGEAMGATAEPFSREARPQDWWAEVRYGLLQSHRAGRPPEETALRFHGSLAAWIAALALETGVEGIFLCGGVFQNGLLLDRAMDICPKACTLYVAPGLPPNDEQIAYGQLIWWLMGQPQLHLDRQSKNA